MFVFFKKKERDLDTHSQVFFFFKQKTAYEITYGDWSSDVCSSDLCLLRTSTTFSVGTSTRVIFSPMPKILARDWMASATLFSNPEYVWTTNHCRFAALPSAAGITSPLIEESFPPPWTARYRHRQGKTRAPPSPRSRWSWS